MKRKTRKKIKKLFKRAERNYFDVLAHGVELLIDNRNDNAFNEGYNTCVSDFADRAEGLAEYIVEQGMLKGELGKDKDGEPMAYFEYDEDLAKVIKEYFNNELNK